MGEAAPHAAGGAHGGKIAQAAGVPGTEQGALQVTGLMALLKIIGLMALKWPNGKMYLWGRDARAGWFVFIFAEGEDGRDLVVTAPDLTALEAELNDALAAAGSGRALT